MGKIDPVTYAALMEARERIRRLDAAVAHHEAVTEWHRARRCILCGDAFQDEGPVWCDLHRLVRAALGLGAMACGHGRDMVRGDGATHWCAACECEDSAEYKTGRG